MKKIFLAVLFFLFVCAMPTYAVTETDGDLQVTYDEPLFPSSTIWYPGLNLRNSIEVKNTGGSIRGLGINSTNTSYTGGLADVLILKVDDGGHYVFGGNGDKTMKDFWNEKDFEVANLGPYETKTIGFTISMPGYLGNEYQGKEAKFDLMIGFLNQSSVILTATSTTNPSTGTVLAVTSNPFAGFFGTFEEVLGESTSTAELTPILSPTPTSIGQVKGVTTKNLSKYIFPVILLILLILLIIFL